MQVANFVLDAVNAVLDWDMPDEAYPDAVNAQVSLLAGQDDGDWAGHDLDVAFH